MRKHTLNYFVERIAPELARDKTVLLGADGNSVGVLVMSLERLTSSQILSEGLE